MSNSKSIKNLKYVLISLAILFMILLISLFIPHVVLKLKGKNNLIINVGSEYKEQGITATYQSIIKKERLDFKISGKVDTAKIGQYKINYEVQKNGKLKKITRIVNVVDNEKPIITLNEPVKGCKEKNTVDIKAMVTDNYDGDLTDKLQYKVTDDKIELSVVDSSKNKQEQIEEITFIDSEAPVINLNGNEKTYITVGSEYKEQGATASDSCDGDLTNEIQISGNVLTNTLGTYEIIYKVTDSSGVTIEKKRQVIVSEKKESNDTYVEANGGVLYLTFDDGPGIYTDDILNILDKYGIKATFFVTNQFGSQKYLNKINEEYTRGHTVGIHTYSHKWSIYDSVDTYLNDFNKMENIVYEQTGVHPKYFRFPGGTSNTVSKKHKVGIMTELANLMTQKGYTYFDWNIDCGDTHKNTSVNYIIKTVKSQVKGNGTYIILMHDIKKNTLEALPTIIEYYQARNFTFKKIDENTPLKQFKPLN